MFLWHSVINWVNRNISSISFTDNHIREDGQWQMKALLRAISLNRRDGEAWLGND